MQAVPPAPLHAGRVRGGSFGRLHAASPSPVLTGQGPAATLHTPLKLEASWCDNMEPALSVTLVD